VSKMHTILVTIETDDAEPIDKATERLHGWLETFGHTAVSHGFEFIETGVKATTRKQQFEMSRKGYRTRKAAP
jgi:hypothetical protein